jgi:hypothetical protein
VTFNCDLYNLAEGFAELKATILLFCGKKRKCSNVNSEAVNEVKYTRFFVYLLNLYFFCTLFSFSCSCSSGLHRICKLYAYRIVYD